MVGVQSVIRVGALWRTGWNPRTHRVAWVRPLPHLLTRTLRTLEVELRVRSSQHSLTHSCSLSPSLSHPSIFYTVPTYQPSPHRVHGLLYTHIRAHRHARPVLPFPGSATRSATHARHVPLVPFVFGTVELMVSVTPPPPPLPLFGQLGYLNVLCLVDGRLHRRHPGWAVHIPSILDPCLRDGSYILRRVGVSCVSVVSICNSRVKDACGRHMADSNSLSRTIPIRCTHSCNRSSKQYTAVLVYCSRSRSGLGIDCGETLRM